MGKIQVGLSIVVHILQKKGTFDTFYKVISNITDSLTGIEQQELSNTFTISSPTSQGMQNYTHRYHL